jgi:hypothetical protein
MEKHFYPSWLWDIKLQPVNWWYPTCGESHNNFPLYQRSTTLLNSMTQLNANNLKKGYVIGINNLPVNMNGETWNIQVYAKTSDGQYIFAAALNQLAMNMNINPNMWPGQAQGVYSRSTYLPEFQYNILKTQAMKIGKSSNYQLAAILTYAAFPE